MISWENSAKGAAVPVTAAYLDRFKKNYISKMKRRPNSRKSFQKRKIKLLEKTPFSNFFANQLPYYRNVLVDGEGNILVFKWTDCIDACTKIFQVYSPQGEFICETRIDEGPFRIRIDGKKNNIAFTSNAIYGLFQLKNSDDVSLRLIKKENR